MLSHASPTLAKFLGNSATFIRPNKFLLVGSSGSVLNRVLVANGFSGSVMGTICRIDNGGCHVKVCGSRRSRTGPGGSPLSKLLDETGRLNVGIVSRWVELG